MCVSTLNLSKDCGVVYHSELDRRVGRVPLQLLHAKPMHGGKGPGHPLLLRHNARTQNLQRGIRSCPSRKRKPRPTSLFAIKANDFFFE